MPDDFYAEAIHELARRHVPSALDCDGEPLRIGVEAEPFLVTPNQAEAESLVGQEFHDDEDFVLALDGDRRPRRAERDHHDRGRLLRAARDEDRDVHRYRVDAPQARAGVAGRARATRCSRGSSPPGTPAAGTRSALREAVAAGAASVLELGAGNFDPREAPVSRRA